MNEIERVSAICSALVDASLRAERRRVLRGSSEITMPLWLYQIRPLYAAIIIMVAVETVSLFGLFLARRFLVHRFHSSEGINDAISGTVQAIGVFYGITVGLIAVAVWNTHTQAAELVS